MPAPAGDSPFKTGRAIDILKAAARLDRVKKEVTLNDGTVFVFWSRPLVAAERERAQKDAGSSETNAFVLQLLVNKATDEAGVRIFSPGDIADLKNAVREEDLNKLELAILSNEQDTIDPKS